MTGALWTAVKAGIGALIEAIAEVVQSLVGTTSTGTTAGMLSDLLPLFAIGISIALFGFAFRTIKSIIWGA